MLLFFGACSAQLFYSRSNAVLSIFRMAFQKIIGLERQNLAETLFQSCHQQVNQLDRAGGHAVIIVDEMLARTTWPGQSAIGKKISAEHTGPNGFEWMLSEVVGVVEHLHNHSLTREVRGQLYMPFEQSRRLPLKFRQRSN